MAYTRNWIRSARRGGGAYRCYVEERTRAEEAEAREAALRETVIRHLTNLQPHIAQLPEQAQPFIDAHVNLALDAARAAKEPDK